MYILIAPVLNIRITDDLGDGEVLMDGPEDVGKWLITNNRELIHELLTPGLRKACGDLEAQLIQNAGAVFYRRHPLCILWKS